MLGEAPEVEPHIDPPRAEGFPNALAPLVLMLEGWPNAGDAVGCPKALVAGFPNGFGLPMLGDWPNVPLPLETGDCPKEPAPKAGPGVIF